MLGRRGWPAPTRGRGARRGRTTVTRESSPARKGRGAVIGCTQAQDRYLSRCRHLPLWRTSFSFLEADILGTPVLRLVVRGPGTEVQRPHGGLWGSHAMAGHGGTLAVVAPQVKQAGVHVGVAGGRTRSIGGTGVHAAIQCFLRLARFTP